MALLKNYAIWNNKGGVGKSTITYHIATRYAELHPDQDILVIDMCPQANVSMMLLGGGNGSDKVLRHSSEQTPRTVVGYMTKVIENGEGTPPPTANDFAIQIQVENSQLPDNMYLLCGDGLLEIIAPGLIERSEMRQFGNNDPWIWIHLIIRKFIEDFTSSRNRDVVVFIDTNPAFGIYTEIAMSAADNIICPVNADDSSRVAAGAMMVLLHGSIPPHPLYSTWSFATKAQSKGLNIPKVHLIIGNRMTQYDGAATAYRAMADATTLALYDTYQTNPGYFTNRQMDISNLDDFQNQYSVQLRDFNTSGVVTTYIGNLLSHMHSGTYTIHGENVQIDNRRISDCLTAVDEVIARI